MPTPLWTPSEAFKQASGLAAYMRWLAEKRGLVFDDYAALWRWSVEHLEDFWASQWDYFQIQASAPYTRVLGGREMPGAAWFEGARLNYAEHVFRNANEHPALCFRSETVPDETWSWAELHRAVASVAASLREMGVGVGDRVVAYVPNTPHAVIAFLACASLGAVWSSCSPDIGAVSVIDRFTQIEPSVLFAIDGYVYGGKPFDRAEVVDDLRKALPTLRQVIHIPYLHAPDAPVTLARQALPSTRAWAEIVGRADERLTFAQVPFAHPLWVLYSSGTTGLPKPITQSQGGILIEHLKKIALHMNLKPGDRFFWFSTTGWMMWNLLLGGLLVGSGIVLYDGSPGAPSLGGMGTLWKLAQDMGVTCFGASAAYIGACIKAGVRPGAQFDLGRLQCLGSTGSPLSPEAFQWIYAEVKRDLWLASVSGGTDVCTAFVGGVPLLPVYSGEIQARCLGADVQAFDDLGNPRLDEVGELVVAQPMPSMPIFFWNDPGMKRYRESYFDLYPGKWRHGDWIRVTPRDTVIIYGRSDSTINRQGVRIGTSEIYRAVEAVDGVLDSLVIDLEMLGRPSYMPLFVVTQPGVALDDALQTAIRARIRAMLSARQLPDDIFAIDEVPRTLNGKKMEVPIKKILLGQPIEKAVSPGSMANPRALDFFVDFARRLRQ